MSTCTFNIAFSGTADELYKKIKIQIENNGGSLNGDATAGTFSVPVLGNSIGGSYTISGQSIAINIDHKPGIISCGQIEKYIKKHIQDL